MISGAAYGVDGAAHRGALTAGGPTIAVLGCGIDVPYPAGHSGLLDRIAQSGLVLSEYPPGTPPARHRFLVRNRLIAALAAGTVVVEAGRRSGSRNKPHSGGTGPPGDGGTGPDHVRNVHRLHELLRTDEASLISWVEEIVESVGRLGTDLAPPPPEERRETDNLTERSLRVHEALNRRSGLSATRGPARCG